MLNPAGQLNLGFGPTIEPSVKTVQLDLNSLLMTSSNQCPDWLGLFPPLTIYVLSICISACHGCNT